MMPSAQQVPITKAPSRSPMSIFNIAKPVKTEPACSDRQFSSNPRQEKSMNSPSFLNDVVINKLPPNKLVKASGKYPELMIKDKDTGRVIDLRLTHKKPSSAQLVTAVKANDFSQARELLLKERLDVNSRDVDGNTVLHIGVLNGNAKVVGLLLYHEAQIDSLNTRLQTPLMIACEKGHDEIAQVLLNAGADINTQDANGNTGLHLATMNNSTRLIELLLCRQSSNLGLRNKEGRTAMEYARNQALFHQAIHQQNKNSIRIYDARTEAGSQHTNSFSEDKVGPNHFKIHALIGRGSFGEVYLVEKLDNNNLLAMKILHKSKIQKQNLTRYALTERNVLSLTKHPFVVRLRYAFQTTDKLCLIMDYCPGGDLSTHLRRELRFPEERVRLYLTQMILALENLHKRDIIFRDLKPDNIVLDAEGFAMLTDFGLSKEGVQDNQTGARSFCGSVAYLAPEMLKRCGHGKAVDWYLLGVVMYELLVGQPPYYANDRDELFNNIQKAELKLPAYISAEGVSLLKSVAGHAMKVVAAQPGEATGIREGGRGRDKSAPILPRHKLARRGAAQDENADLDAEDEVHQGRAQRVRARQLFGAASLGRMVILGAQAVDFMTILSIYNSKLLGYPIEIVKLHTERAVKKST